MNDWIKIAFVENTHGVRGEIRVRSLSAIENRLETVEKVYMGEEKTPMTIKQARPHKGNVLWTFEGIDNINAVEKYKGQYAYVPESETGELPEGSWYYYQLEGLTAINPESRETIGTVKSVEETLANDVLVIERPDGSTFMIPFVDAFVGDIDLENNTIEVTEIEEY